MEGGGSRPADAADFRKKGTDLRKDAARRITIQKKLYPDLYYMGVRNILRKTSRRKTQP